jgi:hypothetical protein
MNFRALQIMFAMHAFCGSTFICSCCNMTKLFKACGWYYVKLISPKAARRKET